MGRFSIKSLAGLIILIGMTGYSCTSSHLQQGFIYQPRFSGPDISSESPVSIEKAEVPTAVLETPDASFPEIYLAETPNLSQTSTLAAIADREYQVANTTGQSINNHEMARKMASEFAETQNKQLTNKQLRKLDRYVAKMEKKQQRRAGDVKWSPSNNLELFFLIAAGVGLVVGILGVGFGWFIFIGCALVYLYFKLLRHN